MGFFFCIGEDGFVGSVLVDVVGEVFDKGVGEDDVGVVVVLGVVFVEGYVVVGEFFFVVVDVDKGVDYVCLGWGVDDG